MSKLPEHYLMEATKYIIVDRFKVKKMTDEEVILLSPDKDVEITFKTVKTKN